MVGAIVLCIIVLFVLSARAEDWTPEEEAEAWSEYEAESAKAGAGEAVPTPDKPPWKTGCSGYCPDLVNGVVAGEQWCAKPKQKCHTSHPARTLAIYYDLIGWIESYNGGHAGIPIAGTIRTESEGAVFAQTSSKTRECGLASIDLLHAEALDINACDPRANVWAAGVFRNRRLLKLRGDFPQATLATLEQQWLMAGMYGSIGSTRARRIIDASGALKLDDDGSLRYDEPHARIRAWLKSLHSRWTKGKLPDLYTLGGEWGPILGPAPGKSAFRVARAWGNLELLRPLYPDGVPWGEPSIVPRPDGILGYPGAFQHCQCWRWPELEGQRPTAVEQVSAIAAMGENLPVTP